MAEELKESGTVIVMSVVGFVFGMMGMLGSFMQIQNLNTPFCKRG
jgi:hypothetical protein